MCIISIKSNKKQVIYHREGCIYAKKIKNENMYSLPSYKAERRGYCECKYCGGLRGKARVRSEELKKREKRGNVRVITDKNADLVYIQTSIGFWRLVPDAKEKKNLLFHRNSYKDGMDFNEAVSGRFHRQLDVKADESVERLINYVIAHDRAKLVIMEDYKRLPQATKKQKKYFRSAQRKERRKAQARLDYLFKSIEKDNAELKKFSIC